MTHHLRLWITAMLIIAATALTIGLAIAAQTGTTQADVPLAGITARGVD